MKNQYAFRVLVAIAASCLAATAAAQPPMSIYRADQAAALAGTSPLSVAGQSPFDDEPGLLSDGQLHFYAARDSAGQGVPISVHKNATLDTVRISFDDQDPWSAPVDPNLSTVQASPAVVPADGYSTITVTVVPRDADGVLLGTGLSVQLDGSALFPGSPVGALVDLGDGSYSVGIRSSAPGQGEIWATVEGVALGSTPLVTYANVGSLDLREQAIAELDVLSEADGAFDQLVEGLDPAGSGVRFVLRARDWARDAYATLSLGDLDEDAHQIEHPLAKAVDELEKALAQPQGVDVLGIQALIDDLVELARKIAVFHIGEAEAGCGACSAGGELCRALDALQEGDDERQSASPDYKRATVDYADAVREAHAALAGC